MNPKSFASLKAEAHMYLAVLTFEPYAQIHTET